MLLSPFRCYVFTVMVLYVQCTVALIYLLIYYCTVTLLFSTLRSFWCLERSCLQPLCFVSASWLQTALDCKEHKTGMGMDYLQTLPVFFRMSKVASCSMRPCQTAWSTHEQKAQRHQQQQPQAPHITHTTAAHFHLSTKLSESGTYTCLLRSTKQTLLPGWSVG